jgi:hypothetical protein
MTKTKSYHQLERAARADYDDAFAEASRIDDRLVNLVWHEQVKRMCEALVIKQFLDREFSEDAT